MIPIVSVIIPNYNYARYIENRIQSVLNQTFQNFELILLDDASSDESITIIEQYRNHPKVSHVEINASNSGSPFLQWEKGISLARGKYIWIAEADDLADKDFLSLTVRALDENPGATVAITMSHLIDGNGIPSTLKPYEFFDEDNSIHIYDGDSYLATRMLFQNSCYNASMTLFRKDAYNNVVDKTYLKMRYAGDWYFWVVMINNHQIAEIRKRLNYFRLHSASTTRKGAKTDAPRFECTLSMLNVLQLSKSVPAPLRRIVIYRAMREYRKDIPNMDVYTPLLQRQINGFKISTSKYILYWIYKHTMSSFVPTRHPRVVRSYNIAQRESRSAGINHFQKLTRFFTLKPWQPIGN